MKILLVNECSNVHTLLAKGLKALGHQVTTISGGNGWRNYPRDISLVRHSSSHLDGIRYLLKLYALLPKMRGYDVVQINNPIFFDVRAERLFYIYDYLRKHNGKVFLGAFGTDHFWVKTCMEGKLLRYSDHNIGEKIRKDRDAIIDQQEWIGTAKERLNKYIAETCDGIIPCLYEYWVCYQTVFPEKTQFIPLPIETGDADLSPASTCEAPQLIRFFIGIDRERNHYKGTDIMLKAIENLHHKYPTRIQLRKAENVPYAQYEKMMNDSDVILDQLYSYTPAMNALLAMSKGLVVVGGGEPENYEILGEHQLRPIINVLPNYESVYHELEELVLNPERIPELKRQSLAYVQKYHDYRLVAKQYETFYHQKGRNK